MDSLAKSINQFALEFSKKLAESAEGKNIFFSPWGISASLAMVYLGTKGTTAAQMAQVSEKGQLSSIGLKWNAFIWLLPSFLSWNPNSPRFTIMSSKIKDTHIFQTLKSKAERVNQQTTVSRKTI